MPADVDLGKLGCAVGMSTPASPPPPAATLIVRGARVALDGGPLLMGILNATPDSFSDAGRYRTLGQRIDRGMQLIADGADLIDVGGESAATDTQAVSAEEEIARVVPVIEGLRSRGATLISADTYKPDVARAAIAAGASIVNDISGLRDPALADVCAAHGAGLVVMHNRGVPKQRLVDPERYADVVEDVLGFLTERTRQAERRGMAPQSLIVDPGPDFSKTPAQTIQVLRNVRRIGELGYPVLMPISRKDFIGALLRRRPRARLAGTLAALDHGMAAGAHIFRIHDVATAKQFIATRLALGRRRTAAAR